MWRSGKRRRPWRPEGRQPTANRLPTADGRPWTADHGPWLEMNRPKTGTVEPGLWSIVYRLWSAVGRRRSAVGHQRSKPLDAHINHHPDIPPRRFGIRTSLVSRFNENAGRFFVQARQTHIQAGLQEVFRFGTAQIYLRIHRQAFRQCYFVLRRRYTDRADKTCGPTGCKKLLGIGTGAVGAWR